MYVGPFINRILSTDIGWPVSQEKFLLTWKDRDRRYKELNRSNDINDATAQQVHHITSQYPNDDTGVAFMVTRTGSYHLHDLAFVDNTSTKDSALSWDLSTLDSSMNRTNLKTDDPHMTLSDCLPKTPTICLTLEANQGAQLRLGAQNLASSGAGMVASRSGLTCHVIPLLVALKENSFSSSPTISHNPCDSKLRLNILDGETVKGFIGETKSDTKNLNSLSSKNLDGYDGSMGSNKDTHNFCIDDKNADCTPTKGESNNLASHDFAEGTMLNDQKASSRIKATILMPIDKRVRKSWRVKHVSFGRRSSSDIATAMVLRMMQCNNISTSFLCWFCTTSYLHVPTLNGLILPTFILALLRWGDNL
jgi:hypothetical protein